VILVAAGLGAIIGSVGLWLARRGTDTRIPFGPFLALGGIAGLVWGHPVVVFWIGRFPS
jgi:leader peptidase (prepilin peptidase)/N-methyltransferase